MKSAAVFLFFFFALSSVAAQAQIADYQRANELMQQHRYEEALPLFEQLFIENRRTHVFFESYIDCLVSLRQFEKAQEVISEQIQAGYFINQANLKLAELLHISGQEEEALRQWRNLSESNPLNIQLLFSIANSMVNRQEFDAAIALYRDARENLRDCTLFLNELGNIYMLAGRFEESVNEFYNLIIESPDQISLVQQRFFRMRDPQLNEIAAFELEDRLLELHYTHPAYSSMAQLLTWLLLETEQYNRAFTFARRYETQTPFTIYSLISLATQLRSTGQFELAAEALHFYLNDSSDTIKNRAREDLAVVYIDWAEHLKRHNLGSSLRVNQLYSKAAELKKELLHSAPDHPRADRILGNLTDILTDHHKNPDLAEEWINRLQQFPAVQSSEWLPYSQGRVALFRGEFTAARQLLTQASRRSQNQTFEERTRYLLSLADFFAGDYDFSLIQLRSIERRSTSFYANDAIQLGIQIQGGLRADTTRALLNTISDGRFLIHTGRYSEAIEKLAPLFAQPGSSLTQSLLIELNSEMPDEWQELKFLLTEYILSSQVQSPHRERLLWDRITLIDQFITGRADPVKEQLPDTLSFLLRDESHSLRISPPTLEQYQSALEDLLMEFPEGFYANFARERLMDLDSLSPGT